MKRKKMMKSVGSPTLGFLRRHKIWTIIVGLLALVAIVLTGIDSYHSYQAYRERLTEKDFSAIEGMAEDTIKKVGGGKVTKTKECKYIRPEVYTDLHLYCSVKMVSYVPYGNDEHAIDIARDLERDNENREGYIVLIRFL